jgi:hypothetical protein
MVLGRIKYNYVVCVYNDAGVSYITIARTLLMQFKDPSCLRMTEKHSLMVSVVPNFK